MKEIFIIMQDDGMDELDTLIKKAMRLNSESACHIVRKSQSSVLILRPRALTLPARNWLCCRLVIKTDNT